MQLFYEPSIADNGGLLSAEESAHCIRVLRHREGDLIWVLDGQGKRYAARIIVASPKACAVQIESVEEAPAFPAACHLAVAPTKNIDRMEWLLEKSTEIGLASITPLLCKNSERKVLKPERLEKILTAATKQSGDFWRPQLQPLTPLKEFLNQDFAGDRFVAHCGDGREGHLKNLVRAGRPVQILIGPEGDFRPDEIELALQKGFIPVSLGTKRLRTETAALAACHIVRLLNE
ncbi:16S rRNA (uracil(1498)-N(3))-methyltransferase [Geofilum rhodophaeum]|uniref:16S rRNA (uracil(1498)-N(3))-methyltransferase n=1 Tax=Geofilum rhodophaeum TaxID=1965019 RepID=UPI000B521A52|nr:16S rRNA (uracil(1498)-N(3))-methyltransferase [Geofilum rhodophaeum]